MQVDLHAISQQLLKVRRGHGNCVDAHTLYFVTHGIVKPDSTTFHPIIYSCGIGNCAVVDKSGEILSQTPLTTSDWREFPLMADLGVTNRDHQIVIDWQGKGNAGLARITPSSTLILCTES